MGKLVFSTKVCLFQSQIKNDHKETNKLWDAIAYFPGLAVKAPHRDLCFLKTLRGREIRPSIFLLTFNLYVNESIFDDLMDEETEKRIVSKLEDKKEHAIYKRRDYVYRRNIGIFIGHGN